MKYLQRFAFFLAFTGILFSGIFSSFVSAEDLIHVVGRGDTIYSLSRFYQVTADELMSVNGITDPSRIQVGQRLIIPSSAFSDVVVPANSAAASGNTQNLVEYRAVRGDTLFGIARNHGITLQALLDINRFPSNHVLRAGDIVRVPGQNTGAAAPSPPVTTGVYALRWPVTPKEITYMVGQMGVVVEGEQYESVLSLTHGNVVSAGPWRKYGRVVIIETAGGYFYMYGGCETLSVNVGDRITPGMELGRLGINAVSEKPQLFFMVFRSDTPIDPATAPRA